MPVKERTTKVRVNSLLAMYNHCLALSEGPAVHQEASSASAASEDWSPLDEPSNQCRNCLHELF